MGAMRTCCPDKKSRWEVSGVMWVHSFAGQETQHGALGCPRGLTVPCSEGEIVQGTPEETQPLPWLSLHLALPGTHRMPQFTMAWYFYWGSPSPLHFVLGNFPHSGLRVSHMSPPGPQCLQEFPCLSTFGPSQYILGLNFSIHGIEHCSLFRCFCSLYRWRLNSTG